MARHLLSGAEGGRREIGRFQVRWREIRAMAPLFAVLYAVLSECGIVAIAQRASPSPHRTTGAAADVSRARCAAAAVFSGDSAVSQQICCVFRGPGTHCKSSSRHVRRSPGPRCAASQNMLEMRRFFFSGEEREAVSSVGTVPTPSAFRGCAAELATPAPLGPRRGLPTRPSNGGPGPVVRRRRTCLRR